MKIRDRIGKLKNNKTLVSIMAACSPFIIGMGNCYAADTADVMNKVANLIYDIFKYVGFVLALWGVGQLILAFKNEDADSKSRAIMCIVAGVALFTFKTFAAKLGLTV